MNQQLDQALLNYTEEQYADFCKRRETFGHETFFITLDEFARRPELYAKSKLHLQHEVAKYIMQQVSEHINEKEILAEYAAQRAIVVIEMLQAKAEEGRKKQKRN